MTHRDLYADIKPRSLTFHFVEAPGSTAGRVRCRCGHDTPRRVMLAVPVAGCLLGVELEFPEAEPEKCADCLARDEKMFPRIAVCGNCQHVILPGFQVCIGLDTPRFPHLATFVGGAPEESDKPSPFLICTNCSHGNDDYAGVWNGKGILAPR